MRTVESTDMDTGLPLEQLHAVFEEHPVECAILFGSHATATTHPRSDIDIAVALELTDRTDPAYNDAFFSLSAEVSETLGADDVDLVDIHTLSPRIGEAVFEQGLLLFGDPESVADLRTQVSAASNTAQSPRQRFDQALAKIDEHLGHAAATTADEHDHE
jgi:predicted nucleotidyltransferase